MSGRCGVHVTIDGIDVLGSPFLLSVTPAALELSKYGMSGDGFKEGERRERAIAGETKRLLIRPRDRFENPTAAAKAEGVTFSLAMTPAGEASPDDVARLSPGRFEGSWSSEQVYEMEYSPEKAGEYMLHAWMSNGAGLERQRTRSPSNPLNPSNTLKGSGSASRG